MVESSETEVPNGVYVQVVKENNEHEPYGRREETLYGVLHGLIAMVLFPDRAGGVAGASLLHRIKVGVSEKGPLLCDACRNTGRDVLLWTRKGSPRRALLVISVGTISGLALTSLFLFMLFLVAATVNAVVVALLMSLAAAGGVLALLLVGLTALYIGALSVAVFVISTVTISAIVAALVATGWAGFFLTVWLATKKSVGLAKHSLNMTGSALSAYFVARHHHHHHHLGANKHSD